MTKADKAVYAQIKANTDFKGWGLELFEIVTFTGFALGIVRNSLSSLKKLGLVCVTKSHVAEHIFYNNAKGKINE